jgi:hypothetical protein
MPKQTLFVLTAELQQVLDNLPSLEPRSRLDPLRPFILRWRREGRSYRKIQQILEDKCNVQVHNETLRRFVKRRAKPRKPQPEVELPQAPVPQAHLPAAPSASNANLTQGADQNRPTLQSFRNKPALEPKPTVLVEFHYDEDKPLTIDRTIKD